MNKHSSIRHCPDGYPVFRLGCRMTWRDRYCHNCPHHARFSLVRHLSWTRLASLIVTTSFGVLSIFKA
ncbi:MAG: hypothetical protein HQL84_09180 [Magnetococcales bacterium]|nr:hypothetical protein [Magnetococcales bacterium]MBF0150204.1 hypothetical protein [Magnetococcales bacterium]MBF0174784.1 hypothetical protein [Magnetococcales bacterium]MBF0631902.1 hypothetical protein [Magnetococcales bacterium]